MSWRIPLLVFGVFCTSTAIIMIKLCSVAALPLAGYRLLVAACVLLPLYLRDRKRHNFRMTGRQLALAAVAGAMIGGHFISWIFGCRMTLVANASLIVNLLPIVMPFLLYFMVRERPTAGEWCGTAMSVAGLGLLAGLDFQLSATHFAGDSLCFLAMILLTSYLAMGRLSRSFPTVWLYVVPMYFFGAVVCLVAGAAAGSSFDIATAQDWLTVIGLGIIPTVVGHSILSYCMRHLRGQVVSIANLGEFIFSTAMAMVLLGQKEFPRWNFYAAAVLVVAGAIWVVYSPPKNRDQGIGTRDQDIERQQGTGNGKCNSNGQR